MTLVWKTVEGTPEYGTTIRRAWVPGGWLVKVETWRSCNPTVVGFTFVPENPHKEWELPK